MSSARPELPTAHSAEFTALTGMRGLAALWVMGCHCWYYLGMPELRWGPIDLGKFLALGWIGVLVFFLLSGFLLAQPFIAWRRRQGPRPDTAAYLYRRVLRVFPAYYFQLIVLLLLAWFNGQTLISDLRSALTHIFMLFHLGSLPAPIVGVWWTLPVEFGFYLALPVLALSMNRSTGVSLLLIGALALSMFHHYLGDLWLHEQSIQDRSNFARQMPGYLCIFAMGCAARWYWHDLHAQLQRSPALSPLIASIALMLLVWMMYIIPLEQDGLQFWTNPYFYYLWKPAVGAIVAILVLACTDPRPWFSRLLSSRLFTWLGDISYSLYLWHLPIILMVADRAASWGLNSPSQWLLVMALTLLIASLSARLIERPFIALGRSAARSAQTHEPGTQTRTASCHTSSSA